MTDPDLIDSQSGPRDPTPVERIAQAFEVAWQASMPPCLHDFLPADPACRGPVLIVLVHLDLERRLDNGEHVRIEDYLQAFPELADDSGAILDLIQIEYARRRQREPGCTPLEFVGRFPHLGSGLRSRFADMEGQENLVGAPTAERFPEYVATQDPLNLLAPTETCLTPNVPAIGEADVLTVPLKGLATAEGAPPDLLIAGHEILGELGRGAMGVVYKARQVSLKRQVALKMILAGSHASPRALERFRTEAEAVARLAQPNIVQIYEIGEHDGQPYFSLEFCAGGSLARKLGGAPQPPHEAAGLIEVLARAMHAAHQAGVIHRDLKPANVLLANDGTPKIADFGLAKKLDEPGMTASGDIMGTPSYMAPEQAGGKVKEMGPATDVYALGAILYELLTGRPPFRGATQLDTLLQVVSLEPVPPSRLQPQTQRDLETICLKCLQKEPRQRYASAEALADDLRCFLANEPIAARRAGPVERALMFTRRRPALAGLVLASALALMSLAAGGWIYVDRLRSERERLAAAQQEYRDFVRQGKLASAEEKWREARDLFYAAKTRAEPEPLLVDLAEEAETLRAEAARKVDHEEARQDAAAQRVNAKEFHAQFNQFRDEALFHAAMSSGPELASHLRETKAAVLRALALFGVSLETQGKPVMDVSAFTSQEIEDITQGCYELLLVWAEVEMHPLPGQADADQRLQAELAMRVLDRAEQLAIATRSGHLLRAACLDRLGRQAEALAEKAQAGKPEGAVDCFLSGVEAYQRADFPRARSELLDARRLRSEHFGTQYFLALASLRTRHFDEAVASLTSCINRHGEYPWLYLYRGFAYTELGEQFQDNQRRAEADAHFARADSDFHEALKHAPDDEVRHAFHVYRGTLRLRQEKLAEAAADLQTAVAMRPTEYQAHVNLAEVFKRQNKLDAASGHLDEAIRLKPKLATLYRARAVVHFKRKDRDAALRDLNQALDLSPPEDSTRKLDYLSRGLILQQTKHYAEAVKDYDAALTIDARLAKAHRWRGESLLQLSESEKDPAMKRDLCSEAVRCFDRYEKNLKDEAADATFYRARGLAKARLNNAEGAVVDFTLSLKERPNDAGTLLHRGLMYLGLKKPQEALDDFDAAMKLDPNDGDVHSGRGLARVQLGKVREGVADVDKALSLGKETRVLLYRSVRVYAEAAGQVDMDMRLPLLERGELRRRYEDRAVQLLRRTLDKLPASERRAFWGRTVLPDAMSGALKSLRRHKDFVQMAEAEKARK